MNSPTISDFGDVVREWPEGPLVNSHAREGVDQS